MDRRRFLLTSLAGTLFAPLGAETAGVLITPVQASAQSNVPRVGILHFAATTSDMLGPEPRHSSTAAFLEGMRELGYMYGRDFLTEPRGGEGKPELWAGQAAELTRLHVNTIVAAGPNLLTLTQATSTIPIVMAAGDPVADAFVRSLNRPGGNVTGLTLQETDTAGKRLELLKELVPSVAPIAVLWTNTSRSSAQYLRAAETAARARGWRILTLEVREPREIDGAFRAAVEAHASALLDLATAVTFARARQVAELAARSRLAAMYGLRAYVDAGGLIAYGADIRAIWRRSATFVAKILKGAKPGDLPVEQPTKFELVINLKSANALGLTIPPSLLARADQVIE